LWGREEQCKRDLEDLQTRLGREMAERQMTQKQLQDELERARAEMAWQDRHKQQTEQERNELATRVRLLEDRVKEESTEKQKLEGTTSLPCVRRRACVVRRAVVCACAVCAVWWCRVCRA
jgi:chromosome segregation ATPase